MTYSWTGNRLLATNCEAILPNGEWGGNRPTSGPTPSPAPGSAPGSATPTIRGPCARGDGARCSAREAPGGRAPESLTRPATAAPPLPCPHGKQPKTALRGLTPRGSLLDALDPYRGSVRNGQPHLVAGSAGRCRVGAGRQRGKGPFGGSAESINLTPLCRGRAEWLGRCIESAARLVCSVQEVREAGVWRNPGPSRCPGASAPG